MDTLVAHWNKHRLGLLYGGLWSLAPMIILEQLPLGNYYNGTEDFKQLPVRWTTCLVMLAASLPTGVLMTSMFRKLAKGKPAKWLWIGGPLALLAGTAIFGLLYSQIAWATLSHISETWTQLTLGSIFGFPLFAFFSPVALVLIPLAGLNTWHLWRQVNVSLA
jgi:hypothetical protein